MSQRDPDEEDGKRPLPVWLVVIGVLLVAAFVALHLTGVVGGGMH